MKKSINITVALSLALGAFLTPMSSHAKGGGNGPGHGGDVVACFKNPTTAQEVRSRILKNRKIKEAFENERKTIGIPVDPILSSDLTELESVDLLEFYEQGTRTSAVNRGHDLKQIGVYLQSLLDIVAGKNMVTWFHLYGISKNRLPLRNFNISKSAVIEIDDSGEKILLPSKCLLLQIAVQSVLSDSGSEYRTVVIDERLFDYLTPKSQAALIQHERLWPFFQDYANRVGFELKDSTRIRRFNQFYFSDELETMTPMEFTKFTRSLGVDPNTIRKEISYTPETKITFDRFIAQGLIPSRDYIGIDLDWDGFPSILRYRVQTQYEWKYEGAPIPAVVEQRIDQVQSGIAKAYFNKGHEFAGFSVEPYYGPNGQWLVELTYSHEAQEFIKAKLIESQEPNRILKIRFQSSLGNSQAKCSDGTQLVLGPKYLRPTHCIVGNYGTEQFIEGLWFGHSGMTTNEQIHLYFDENGIFDFEKSKSSSSQLGVSFNHGDRSPGNTYTSFSNLIPLDALKVVKVDHLYLIKEFNNDAYHLRMNLSNSWSGYTAVCTGKTLFYVNSSTTMEQCSRGTIVRDFLHSGRVQLFEMYQENAPLSFYPDGSIKTAVVAKKIRFENGCRYRPGETITYDKKGVPSCK